MLQQADVLRKHTSLRVSHFCGDMNVDYWDRRRWGKELQEQDIWVMTPQILLNVLRHGFLKVSHLLQSTHITHPSLQAYCNKSLSCVFHHRRGCRYSKLLCWRSYHCLLCCLEQAQLTQCSAGADYRPKPAGV